MTTIHTTLKRVEILRSGALRQKWRARFIADNNLTLAKTSEHYANLGDLKAMLAKYYPDWPVTVRGRSPDFTKIPEAAKHGEA